MPEFFCELLSEEIPARLQAGAAADFARLAAEALAPLGPVRPRSFAGPRRIAVAFEVAPLVPETRRAERGPRIGAPEAALAGFLRKHAAERAALREEGGFWVLDASSPAVSAAELIARALPPLLWRFPWPKTMRWGTSAFAWVRPLRRICCLLDGAVVPFALATAEDAAHGLAAGDLTEGHRFMAPGVVAVRGLAAWEEALRARHVVADAAARERLIAEGIAARAAEVGAAVVDDPLLLREVAGLVEWPVCLRGRIDPAFMDLPPEVMQVSMRVNQRYFALRLPDGRAAPYFAFAANIAAPDGGAAIVAGNERVLRARFADARYFWDQDREVRLEDRVAEVGRMTFNAALGPEQSQQRRIERMTDIGQEINRFLRAPEAEVERAIRLCKADLSSGMVGEFPELQGIMGGYYAAHDGEAPEVAAAIREHYQPRGPTDAVPRSALGMIVALADKLDSITAFFSVGVRPTGSADPFALRRAALGVVRIITENALRIELIPVLRVAAASVTAAAAGDAPRELATEVLNFILDRLRVQLREGGARPDVVRAVLASGVEDDLTRLLARSEAVTALLGSADGANLLAGHRRAANILRIEDKNDGPHRGEVDARLLVQDEERALHAHLSGVGFAALLAAEDFPEAMRRAAALRPYLDAFFDRVTVNAADPALRRNRLRLLSQLRDTIDQIADFSQIQ